MKVPPDHSNPLDRQVGRSAFGMDATGYHQERSGYLDELFERLAKLVPQEPRILEIGAGTGLATQGLLRLSPRVLTLIEPDPVLCAFLKQRFAGSNADIVCGTFPEVSAPQSFDLIACAAAFHWLEPVAALAAIRAALAPGGIWAMWWNCYFGHGQPDPFGEAVQDLLRQHQIVLPPSYANGQHYAVDVAHHVAQLEAAGFANIQHTMMHNRRDLDANGARDLYQTFSFIRLLPETQRTQVLDHIGDLVTSDFGGTAQSLVVTPLYWCSK